MGRVIHIGPQVLKDCSSEQRVSRTELNVKIPVARSSWRLNFVKWPLIFLDPQYGYCHPPGAKHLDMAPSFLGGNLCTPASKYSRQHGTKFVYPCMVQNLCTRAWYKISSGILLPLYRPRNSSNFT